MRTGWTAERLPDLTGRTYIVTGATSGLGLVTARELARVGARVVLAVRDAARGAVLADELGGGAEVRHLDLADLSSVRAFAQAWTGPIDVLINNAGVMAVPEGRTADGFETQMGTNHLGHFALTGLLLPHLSDRVVTIASGFHRRGTLPVEVSPPTAYRPWVAYSQSKLANLLFSAELQRRLDGAGLPLRSLAAHPGYAATSLQSRTGVWWQHALMVLGNRVLAQSVDVGARAQLYAATQDLPGDSYVGPVGRGENGRYPVLVSRSDAAKDADAARLLWEDSERVTGVRYDFGAHA